MDKKNALDIAKENYTSYSKYVAAGRAYASIFDGTKTVYKRAVYGMYKNNKHKITKVAELAAHALPYHPHPTSVAGVIIQLGEAGNKLKLMKTQGNWGNSKLNVEASAERYIGGYLSPLAEALLCDSIDYCKFEKGEIERDEPVALPTFLPLCFINGLSGIPSGLPTLNVPTLDIDSMIDYYIQILKKKDLNYKPKQFPKPNYDCDIISDPDVWDQIMQTGKGTIKLAPKMMWEDSVIVIYEFLKGKNAESVHKILDKEFLADKNDIRDETTSSVRIVVEKVPHKQVDMEEIYQRLYNKLQANENCNMAFFDKSKIYVPCGFHSVVKANLTYVIETHKNRIAHELTDLRSKLKVLQIIESMKKSNKVKDLIELSFEEAVKYITEKYQTTKDIASKVLQKPISYLTKEHLKEIEDLENDIKLLEEDDRDIYEFLIKKYKNLKKLIAKELAEQSKIS